MVSEATPFSGDWKGFERITAAIHKFRDAGADVRWNERLDGRQLDVTVRFERGGYRFLVIIECKNLSRPVEIGEVDSFVTKSKDLGANKAVMVASRGFSSGAKDVAKRHDIQILTLEEISLRFLPEKRVFQKSGLNILSAALWTRDRFAPIVLTTKTELNRARFHAAQGQPQSLTQVVQGYYRTLNVQPPESRRIERVALVPPCRVTLPAGNVVVATALDVTLQPGKVPEVATVIPPELPFMDFLLTDAVSGQAIRFDGGTLPIGLDAPFIAGRFYRNILGLIYRCEKVDDDEVQLFGFLGNQQPRFDPKYRDIKVRFTAPVSVAPLYAELADAAQIVEFETKYQQHLTIVEGVVNQPPE